jgi:hypothetical protein
LPAKKAPGIRQAALSLLEKPALPKNVAVFSKKQ